MNEHKPKIARRELFRSLGRGLAAAGLLAAGIVLGTRGSSDGSGGRCSRKGFCRSCRQVGSCGRPEAMNFRKAKGDKS